MMPHSSKLDVKGSAEWLFFVCENGYDARHDRGHSWWNWEGHRSPPLGCTFPNSVCYDFLGIMSKNLDSEEAAGAILKFSYRTRVECSYPGRCKNQWAVCNALLNITAGPVRGW